MKIIVWKHKHGEYYYDASTPENREASAKQIVHELLYDMQYIYKPSDEVDLRYANIDMELAHLTDEQVNALPTESLKDEANKHRKNLKRRYKEHEDEKAAYDMAVKLAAGEDVWVSGQGRSAFNDPARYDAFAEKNANNPNYRFKDDGTYIRRYTAWDYIVNERSGGEYEDFDIEDVWSPEKSS